MTANLLTGNEHNFRDFSEWTLIDHANQADFDSAIPRFESWRPSQITVRNCSRSSAKVRQVIEKAPESDAKNSSAPAVDRLKSENLTVSMAVYQRRSGC
jgi:hypothetical protein